MKTENIPKFFATLKAANPMPVTELEYTSVFELADRRAAERASHRRGCEQGDATALPGGEHAGQDIGAGVGWSGELHQNHWPVPQQSQTPAANLPNAG